VNRPELFDELHWRPTAVRVHRAPALRATIVEGPTAGSGALLHDGGMWRLISLLATSTASLVAGPRPLIELLEVFEHARGRHTPDVADAVRDVRASSSVRRVRTARGSGFVHGTCVEVLVDRDAFAGTSLLVFGTLLHRFFAQQCAANSFVELRLCDAQGTPIHSWPARLGDRELL
jgi:type VI secretion system protein ImpG